MNWTSVAALVAFALATPQALAQGYPTKPVALLVPFAAGGPTDTVARSLAQSMGKALGQTIVVENAPGAGGTIAPTKLKNAAPDGYTLLIAHIGMSTAPSLYRTLPFKPIEDFEHIGQVVDVPMTFIGKKDLPPNDFKALVDYVKANKEKVTLANAGIGAASHLCGLLFMSAIQTDLTTVPYKGTAPAINDLLGGQTQAMFPGLAAALPQIRAGKIRALAVTGRERSPQLPDVPTMEQAGFKGFDAMQWYGSAGPANMPAEVVKRLNDTQVQVLRDPELREKLAVEAVEPWPMTPAEFGKFIQSEVQRWSALAKARNIHLED